MQICLLMCDLRSRFIVCGPASTETSVHTSLVSSGIYMLAVSAVSRHFFLHSLKACIHLM